ncbi:prepilin-type N-terminal cleavage/methylation domain-containing protein [Cyanobium sp. CH-040]|nr:prepilin-type N-terminal cleavage/methylation domain-containing protein [Cyanobium sp. CH-040]
MGRRSCAQGYTLPELLVAVLVLGLLLAVGLYTGQGFVARQRVEVAARELAMAIERERDLALRQGRPRSLSVDGPGGLLDAAQVAGGRVELRHNLPRQLRFSANGLLLDGGTVVVATAGTDLRRCLVMALPVGVLRLGREQAAAGGGVSAASCVRDEAA